MTTQRKNIQNEQFYTQHETAKKLSQIVKNEPWFNNITTIIEPSAGDGVWLDHINVTHAYDIDPKDPRVEKRDFLSTNLGRIPGSLAIGNPPFGRMGTLTKDFINKCAETVDYIAFIVNASMAKTTLIRRVPKNFHLIKQIDLLGETFRLNGKNKAVKTVFQIWERRENNRKDLDKNLEHKDFSFIKAPADADLAILTHGSGFGKIYESNFLDKNTNTHRFFISHIDKTELANRLRTLDYNSYAKYTVGAKCISQEEIVLLYSDKYGV